MPIRKHMRKYSPNGTSLLFQEPIRIFLSVDSNVYPNIFQHIALPGVEGLFCFQYININVRIAVKIATHKGAESNHTQYAGLFFIFVFDLL